MTDGVRWTIGTTHDDDLDAEDIRARMVPDYETGWGLEEAGHPVYRTQPMNRRRFTRTSSTDSDPLITTPPPLASPLTVRPRRSRRALTPPAISSGCSWASLYAAWIRFWSRK